MPLDDYSYALTIGQSCGPCFQLQRAAGRVRIPVDRVTGPFDWLLVDLRQAAQVLARDFAGYFEDESRGSSVLQDGHWMVTDGSGAVAWHQLKQRDGELMPGARVWSEFRAWLAQRIRNWRTRILDPQGNILLIRNESPFRPDSAEDLIQLTELLRTQIAGRFKILWLRYGPPLVGFEDPNVCMFELRRSWPEKLSEEQVDYDRDYGFGTAWRGRDEDWERIWRSV